MEVVYNHRWGTVCDDGWDDTDAGVVCRQLGFGSSGIATESSIFGEGIGTIWLDSVKCTGNESTLSSCGHPGVGIALNCYKDAAVRCYGASAESKLILLYMYVCVTEFDKSQLLHTTRRHTFHYHMLVVCID